MNQNKIGEVSLTFLVEPPCNHVDLIRTASGSETPPRIDTRVRLSGLCSGA